MVKWKEMSSNLGEGLADNITTNTCTAVDYVAIELYVLALASKLKFTASGRSKT